jgi:hypothetical protein
MKKYPIVMWLVACMVLIAGCARVPRAPLSDTGQKIEIMVFSDRGSPAEMTERQYKYRIEVGQYMERDLINRLSRSGYEAKLINSKDEFEPSVGRYLLTVKMVSYNPGSSAARILVGFGAGAASLDNKYEFYGAGSEPIMAWDDGVGTSEHWSRLPKKLNANTVKRITEKLSASK